MNFKTVSIVKCSPEVAWNAMLNHLPQIAESVEDLEATIEKEKSPLSEEVTKVVNIWHARPKLPQLVANHIKPDMLIWTDTALWHASKRTVEWTIFSHYFKEHMHCSGTTVYEQAMGGKGCRMTFSGDFKWNSHHLSLGFGLLDGTILKAAEGVLTQMIPANFRKITESLTEFLSHHSVGS